MKFKSEDVISFAQTTLKIAGTEVSVKTYAYGDSVDSADVEANSQIALARTRGMYKTDDATMDMYIDDFAALMETLKDKFYETSFEITNAYQKLGDSQLTIDTLVLCRFSKRGASDSSSADPLMRTVGYKPRYIKWNGHNPISNMPDGAK